MHFTGITFSALSVLDYPFPRPVFCFCCLIFCLFVFLNKLKLLSTDLFTTRKSYKFQLFFIKPNLTTGKVTVSVNIMIFIYSFPLSLCTRLPVTMETICIMYKQWSPRVQYCKIQQCIANIIQPYQESRACMT